MTGGGRPVEWRLAELERRLASALRYGTIEEVDAGKGLARARYADAPPGGEPAATGWLPWFAWRAGETRDWSAPSAGEAVMILAPYGELAAGAILAGLYQARFPAPEADPAKRVAVYADGALVAYDAAKHELSAVLPDGGKASLKAPGGLAIEGDTDVDGDLAVDGDLSVTGRIEASGNVSDAAGSMAKMRRIFDGHTHVIPGPPPTTVPAPLQKMG